MAEIKEKPAAEQAAKGAGMPARAEKSEASYRTSPADANGTKASGAGNSAEGLKAAARAQAVTEADVRAAMAELESCGAKPTQRSVRDRLGRGSYGTIHALIAKIREDELSAQRAAAKAALDITPLVETLGRQLAQQAVAERIRDYEAKLRKLDAIICDLKDKYSDDLRQMSQRADEAIAKAMELGGRVSEIQEKLEKARKENALQLNELTELRRQQAKHAGADEIAQAVLKALNASGGKAEGEEKPKEEKAQPKGGRKAS